MKKYSFEVCANSVESCIAAEQGGAVRVELCASIPEGGTTPSYGEIRQARNRIDIALHVIIRPRCGDFLYTPLELERMLYDIEVSRSLGVDGVVFGCLTPDGDVDMEAMSRLIKSSEGMAVTFHRAFDMCRDQSAALEQIISLGCSRVLTSGGAPTALEGVSVLQKMVEQAAGRIVIMPGCGINDQNIMQIAEQTGASEFHLSARSVQQSGMSYRKGAVEMGSPPKLSEYEYLVTDSQKLAYTIGLVNRSEK